MSEEPLLFREWFIVVFVVCFIAVIFLAQSFSFGVPRLEVGAPLQPLKIEVWVYGEVQSPGLYEVELGSTLQSILNKAQLKNTADKKALYLQKKVLQSCSLVVPEKKCRKDKKKKRDSSSMAPVSYADKNGRNLSKASENICSRSVSRNF